MLSLIAKFLLSGGASSIVGKLGDAYEAKLQAQNEKERLEADTLISQLEIQQGILLAEQQRWYTAWIRPLIALPIVVYIWKIVFWDTVLQWGVTPYPGDFVHWLVVTVVGAYFLTRPFERK